MSACDFSLNSCYGVSGTDVVDAVRRQCALARDRDEKGNHAGWPFERTAGGTDALTCNSCLHYLMKAGGHSSEQIAQVFERLSIKLLEAMDQDVDECLASGEHVPSAGINMIQYACRQIAERALRAQLQDIALCDLLQTITSKAERLQSRQEEQRTPCLAAPGQLPSSVETSAPLTLFPGLELLSSDARQHPSPGRKLDASANTFLDLLSEQVAARSGWDFQAAFKVIERLERQCRALRLKMDAASVVVCRAQLSALVEHTFTRILPLPGIAEAARRPVISCRTNILIPYQHTVSAHRPCIPRPGPLAASFCSTCLCSQPVRAMPCLALTYAAIILSQNRCWRPRGSPCQRERWGASGDFCAWDTRSGIG